MLPMKEEGTCDALELGCILEFSTECAHKCSPKHFCMRTVTMPDINSMILPLPGAMAVACLMFAFLVVRRHNGPFEEREMVSDGSADCERVH